MTSTSHADEAARERVACRMIPLLVVMGVSGSGKSTVAGALATRLGCAMLEGDDLHPRANVAIMSAGTPLSDADRQVWLEAIATRLGNAARAGSGLVVACSALKRRYRDILRSQAPGLILVHLKGAEALVEHRMAARSGHFMPPALLESQFAILETPGADETVIECDVARSIPDTVEAVLQRLAAQ